VTRHYLDHASTSPTRPVAIDAITRALHDLTGDPGRIHREGITARVAIESARDEVAAFFGCRSSREVVFTSGATESIATAVFGSANRGGHQVVTAVEHSAVRLAVDNAGESTVVGVDGLGRVDADGVARAIRTDTACVHVQWGNHEVGTVQPVMDVVAACRERDVLVHVDAAQAAGHVAIAFESLGCDLMSVSAHKLGGGPGVGALLVRRGVRLRPLLVGGDQERARRAGYENVPAIAGFGAALASIDVEAEAAAQGALTARLLAGIDEGLVPYGDLTNRLPHLLCFGVPGIEPQAVLLGLDRAGIAAHSGSACSSEALEPSPVLRAMGVDAHRSLRLSVGWSSTADDIDAVLNALPRVIADLRRLTR
jgi:cysteine desulfurase